MKYIKTYCYAEHEINFIKAQLIESEGYIDYVVVYEYDVTHRGEPKDFKLQEHIKSLDKQLSERLIYRQVSLKNYCVKTSSEKELHEINEPIQRSYFFNDPYFDLKDNDEIFDVDVDEIIYKNFFKVISMYGNIINRPFSLPLNQFFYKQNYLWYNLRFKSPAYYRYKWVSNSSEKINNINIKHRRDCKIIFPFRCGAHMSWVMPVEQMINKLKSYAHSENGKYADLELLNNAIQNKVYVFDTTRKMLIKELKDNDRRMPKLYHNQKNHLD